MDENANQETNDANLATRVKNLEFDVVRQEHRLWALVHNLFKYRNSPDDEHRRDAAIMAALFFFCSPATIALSAGFLTVGLLFWQNWLIRDSNELTRKALGLGGDVMIVNAQTEPDCHHLLFENRSPHPLFILSWEGKSAEQMASNSPDNLFYRTEMVVVKSSETKLMRFRSPLPSAEIRTYFHEDADKPFDVSFVVYEETKFIVFEAWHDGRVVRASVEVNGGLYQQIRCIEEFVAIPTT